MDTISKPTLLNKDKGTGKKRDQLKSSPWGPGGENPEKLWILAPVQGLKLLFQDLLLRKKVSNLEYSKQSEKLGIPLFVKPLFLWKIIHPSH